MIEKSAEMKIHEHVDAMLESFRGSVRKAQTAAKESGVPVTIVVSGERYNIMPDGKIELVTKQNGA